MFRPEMEKRRKAGQSVEVAGIGDEAEAEREEEERKGEGGSRKRESAPSPSCRFLGLHNLVPSRYRR